MNCHMFLQYALFILQKKDHSINIHIVYLKTQKTWFECINMDNGLTRFRFPPLDRVREYHRLTQNILDDI